MITTIILQGSLLQLASNMPQHPIQVFKSPTLGSGFCGLRARAAGFGFSGLKYVGSGLGILCRTSITCRSHDATHPMVALVTLASTSTIACVSDAGGSAAMEACGLSRLNLTSGPKDLLF